MNANMNANKRNTPNSSSSSLSEETDSDLSLRTIMEKLECMQQSLDSNFAEAMSEINGLRVDVTSTLSILKKEANDLKTSLYAAWIEIEALKQQDEQNKLQLAQLEKENTDLQAEVSAIKARAIKLDNYTRRENIRLLNVPENQDENCKEIVREIMAEVKMENPRNVEFHAVHCVGKQRDDGNPRAIIARFVGCETRNECWSRRKELANCSSHKHITLVPDYAYETAKEQRKLSSALRNARKMNLAPAYIKNDRLFVKGNSYSPDNIPEYLQKNEVPASAVD